MSDQNPDNGELNESHNNKDDDQSTTIVHRHPSIITLPQNLESLSNIVEFLTHVELQPNTRTIESSSYNANNVFEESTSKAVKSKSCEASKRPRIECDDMEQNPREVRARRTRLNEEHVSSERRRRDRMRQKLTTLKELLPNTSSPKSDQASILDQAITHIKSLQCQIQAMVGVPFSPLQTLTRTCLVPSVLVPSPYSNMTQHGAWNLSTTQHEILQRQHLLSNTMHRNTTASLVHGFEDRDFSFPGGFSPSSTCFDPTFGLLFNSFSSIPQRITSSSHSRAFPSSSTTSVFTDQSSSFAPIVSTYDHSIRGESSNRVITRILSNPTLHQASDTSQAASSSVRPSPDASQD